MYVCGEREREQERKGLGGGRAAGREPERKKGESLRERELRVLRQRVGSGKPGVGQRVSRSERQEGGVGKEARGVGEGGKGDRRDGSGTEEGGKR